VVNVNDAVMPNAPYYVGNVQKDNGVRVAKWFIEHHPQGGKVAVIEGQPGVYAAGQRTRGFNETLQANGKFNIVASVPANWSREQAFNAASTILQQHPDLIGFTQITTPWRWVWWKRFVR
jgi:ribose transport system substrate-binding protein